MTLPNIERLFGQLVVVDRLASAAQVRTALEELLHRRLNGQPDLTLAQVLLERGQLTAAEIKSVRRVREKLVLECRPCQAQYLIQPFNPRFNCICKRCGREMTWPRSPEAQASRPSLPVATDGMPTPPGLKQPSSTASSKGNIVEPTASRITQVAQALEAKAAQGATVDGQTPPAMATMPLSSIPPVPTEALGTAAAPIVAEGKTASAIIGKAGVEKLTTPELEMELIGTAFDEYVVTRLIGRGGMGSVYYAVNPRTHAEAAIKVLAPFAASNPEYLERFHREARLASKLTHPNLIGVLSVGVNDPWVYLVMPYVAGKTLQQVFAARNGPLPIRDVLRYGIEALAGVEAAHALGIIHRDLKPDNIMVTKEGDVRVLDFGLARDADTPQITLHGQTVGTPRFMSPEQWQGATLDPRCDIHAMGMSLYYLLAGSFPYPDADAPLDIYRAMMEHDPVPLMQKRPEVGPVLNEAIMRMVARNPNFRTPDAATARRALENVLPGAGGTRKLSASVTTLTALPVTAPRPTPGPALAGANRTLASAPPALSREDAKPAGDATVADSPSHGRSTVIAPPRTVIQRIRRWWQEWLGSSDTTAADPRANTGSGQTTMPAPRVALTPAALTAHPLYTGRLSLGLLRHLSRRQWLIVALLISIAIGVVAFVIRNFGPDLRTRRVASHANHPWRIFEAAWTRLEARLSDLQLANEHGTPLAELETRNLTRELADLNRRAMEQQWPEASKIVPALDDASQLAFLGALRGWAKIADPQTLTREVSTFANEFSTTSGSDLAHGYLFWRSVRTAPRAEYLLRFGDGRIEPVPGAASPTWRVEGPCWVFPAIKSGSDITRIGRSRFFRLLLWLHPDDSAAMLNTRLFGRLASPDDLNLSAPPPAVAGSWDLRAVLTDVTSGTESPTVPDNTATNASGTTPNPSSEPTAWEIVLVLGLRRWLLIAGLNRPDPRMVSIAAPATADHEPLALYVGPRSRLTLGGIHYQLSR